MSDAPRAQDDGTVIPDDRNPSQEGSVVLVSTIRRDGTFWFRLQPDFRAPSPPAGTVDLSLTRIVLDLLAPDLRLVLLTLADVENSGGWFSVTDFTSRFVRADQGATERGA
jgi:hypothetical protein